MDFVAIDFETANVKRSSVCSMGLVVINNGEVTKRRSWLIRPKELYFDGYNSYIHGITEDHVKGQPEFPEYWGAILPYLESNLVLAHNASFDISVLRALLNEYNMEYPTLTYSCTRIISKKVWPGHISYRLNHLAEQLGITFSHHNAEEDAYACAMLAIRACETSGINSLDELHQHHEINLGRLFPGGYKPTSSTHTKSSKRSSIDDLIPSTDQFNEDHQFFNRTLAFTGTLQSMVRKDAMQKVVDVGGFCSNNVTKDTNFLVVGDLDFSRFKSGEKSSKLKKAEDLLAKGIDIEIIPEDEFIRIL